MGVWNFWLVKFWKASWCWGHECWVMKLWSRRDSELGGAPGHSSMGGRGWGDVGGSCRGTADDYKPQAAAECEWNVQWFRCKDGAGDVNLTGDYSRGGNMENKVSPIVVVSLKSEKAKNKKNPCRWGRTCRSTAVNMGLLGKLQWVWTLGRIRLRQLIVRFWLKSPANLYCLRKWQPL